MEKDYVISPRAQTGVQTPVIEITAQQLGKQIAELQEIAAALETRLSPIMREPEPEPSSRIEVTNASSSSPAQSAFAVMLRQRVMEAERVSDRLSSIIRRLEI